MSFCRLLAYPGFWFPQWLPMFPGLHRFQSALSRQRQPLQASYPPARPPVQCLQPEPVPLSSDTQQRQAQK
jgi:hypothetical protein